MGSSDSSRAAAYVSERLEPARTGVILGSGLGELADDFGEAEQVAYSDVPGMQSSTVEGHAGCFVSGDLDGTPVIAMQGRVHFYETGDIQQVVFPIQVLQELGVEQLVITNAAGGVTPEFDAGDLMLITDHINNMGVNPLIGIYDGKGPRFPDMTEAYDADLRVKIRQVADAQDVDLKKGVYAANTGPNYETPAEVQALQHMGVDAVGMSTVPEVIMSNYLGISVAGISLITNQAAGIGGEELSHDEVIETAESRKPVFKALVRNAVQRIG